MKQFYVKEPSKLKDFGFNYKNGMYFIVTHRATNIWVDEDSMRLVFQSPSKDCIAIVCEMYKQGVIEILDDEEKVTYNMKVTEEEMKWIFEKRNEKKST